LLFGFLAASMFISRLTSAMTRVQMMQDSFSKSLDFSMLRRYLAKAGISKKLILRIQRNAKHTMAQISKSTPESEIKLLHLVSEPLLMELHFELHNPVLVKHHLFKLYSDLSPPAMRRVCHLAVSIKLLSRDDIVFSIGEIPAVPKMFFLLSGVMEYTTPDYVAQVRSGWESTWMSEAVLWTTWMHVGELSATEDSQVLVLDALAFQQVADQFQVTGIDLASYADAFVQELNTAREGTLSDLPRGAKFPIVSREPASEEEEEKRRCRMPKRRGSQAVPVPLLRSLLNNPEIETFPSSYNG